MKRGLFLQGGGAKGAYQAGAIKALNQKKIYFDGVGGTSIGAINSAFYVTKNFNAMYKLWLKTDCEDLFGIDGKIFDDLSNGEFDMEDFKHSATTIKNILKNKGIDTSKIKKILSSNINEKKFRRSKIDYAMNTFNLSTMKPVKVYKKDIPDGKLIEYILSSAYLPVFKLEKIIDDHYYVDGGVYNNCPIDMMIDQDYDEIYVIKAWQNKLKYKPKENVKVNIIEPRENLGSIMRFTTSASKYRMDLGYYDMLKFLYNLDGDKYYFKHYDDDYYNNLFDKEIYDDLFDKYNRKIKANSNKEFILKIIENCCDDYNVKRFKIYNMPYLLTRLKYKSASNRKYKYYDFLKNIKIEFI